jgi:type II secretory pathway component PulF
MQLYYSKKLNNFELLDFFKNLNIFFKYGYTLSATVDNLYKTVKNNRVKKAVGELLLFVNRGYSLSDFILKTEYIPKEYYSLIKVGEQSASLSNISNDKSKISILDTIIIDIKRKIDFGKKIRSALLMPTITFVIVILIVFIILTFLLPTILENLISITNNKEDIPKITLFMFNLVTFYNSHRIIVFACFFSFIALIILFFIKRTIFYKMLGLKIFKVPVIGKLYKYNFYLNIFSSLFTFTNAGISVSQAFKNMIAAELNPVLSQIMSQINKRIQVGYPLHKAFHQSYGGLFEPIILSSLQQSQAGGLLERLDFLINYYSDVLNDIIEYVRVIVQPISLIILGGIIGTMFAGILASIYSFIEKMPNM